MIHVISNARLVAAEFTIASGGLSAKVAAKVRHHTMLLQTRVRAKASGRPGPNAPTGDYRRSIDRRVSQQAGQVAGWVGTNKPQGRRLEMGFSGTDSLGRTFSQPPLPHFGPAVDETQDEFIAGLLEAIDDSFPTGSGGIS